MNAFRPIGWWLTRQAIRDLEGNAVRLVMAWRGCQCLSLSELAEATGVPAQCWEPARVGKLRKNGQPEVWLGAARKMEEITGVPAAKISPRLSSELRARRNRRPSRSAVGRPILKKEE